MSASVHVFRGRLPFSPEQRPGLDWLGHVVGQYYILKTLPTVVQSDRAIYIPADANCTFPAPPWYPVCSPLQSVLTAAVAVMAGMWGV